MSRLSWPLCSSITHKWGFAVNMLNDYPYGRRGDARTVGKSNKRITTGEAKRIGSRHIA